MVSSSGPIGATSLLMRMRYVDQSANVFCASPVALRESVTSAVVGPTLRPPSTTTVSVRMVPAEFVSLTLKLKVPVV